MVSYLFKLLHINFIPIHVEIYTYIYIYIYIYIVFFESEKLTF